MEKEKAKFSLLFFLQRKKYNTLIGQSKGAVKKNIKELVRLLCMGVTEVDFQ